MRMFKNESRTYPFADVTAGKTIFAHADNGLVKMASRFLANYDTQDGSCFNDVFFWRHDKRCYVFDKLVIVGIEATLPLNFSRAVLMLAKCRDEYIPDMLDMLSAISVSLRLDYRTATRRMRLECPYGVFAYENPLIGDAHYVPVKDFAL